MLAVYVQREDDYRADGTSRWDSRDARGLTVSAVAACLVAAALRVYAVRRRGGESSCFVWLADFLAYVLVGLAFVANTAN